jgi:hypothetical protein
LEAVLLVQLLQNCLFDIVFRDKVGHGGADVGSVLTADSIFSLKTQDYLHRF